MTRTVDTVCLALGPYRNLTTLTAATLFLHPNCQVLNHASGRIFDTEYDFLTQWSPQALDRFIDHAIDLSAGGRRGDYGGSITHSHAFDPQHQTRQLFEESGLALVKERITALFWKESHRTSNLIRERGVDLGAMLREDPRLRFLMPIRNPIDCAASNLLGGHVRHFVELGPKPPISLVMRAVLDQIRWFMTLAREHPGRFFHFWEHSMDAEMLTGMAAFLRLSPDPEWLAKAALAMRAKKRYRHDPRITADYLQAVEERFAAFPEVAEQLRRFV